MHAHAWRMRPKRTSLGRPRLREGSGKAQGKIQLPPPAHMDCCCSSEAAAGSASSAGSGRRLGGILTTIGYASGGSGSSHAEV